MFGRILIVRACPVGKPHLWQAFPTFEKCEQTNSMTVFDHPSDLAAHARPNLFEIDLGAIAELTGRIRSHVGKEVTIFAALKCNAYGFGLVPVARTVLSAGADALSLVDPANAIELRRSGVTAPILVYPGSLPTRQELLGFPAEMAAEAIAVIAKMPNLSVHIVNSHPNVPSPPSLDYLDWQLDRFEAVCRQLETKGIVNPLRMIASSKILSLTRRAMLNAADPGQMFFGPLLAEGDVPWPTERQAFRKLTSRLIYVRTIDRRAFLPQAPFPVQPGMRIGVMPIGSADGLAQLHCGEVLVSGTPR
jgi:alanine racemase